MKQTKNVDGVRQPGHIDHSNKIASNRPPLVHTVQSGLDGLAAKSSKKETTRFKNVHKPHSYVQSKILFGSLNVFSAHHKIRFLALAKILFDIRLYILALLPFAVLLPQQTPNGLLSGIRLHKSVITADKTFIVAFAVWTILVLSYVMVKILNGLLYNTTLKQIDHRAASLRSQLKLLLNNWLVNLASLILSAMISAIVALSLGMVVFAIITSASPNIMALTPILLYLCFVGFIISCSVIWLWRRYSLISTSVTTEPSGANIYYTSKLVSKNLLKLLGYSAYYCLVNLFLFGVISLIFVIEVHSITAGLSVISNILTLIISILGYGFVLWYRQLLSTVYWTRVLYRIVHDSAKASASHYLAMVWPFRALRLKFYLLLVCIAVVIGVGGVKIVIIKPYLQSVSDKIGHFQNFDVSKLIPAKK